MIAILPQAWGDELRLTFRLAWPLALAQLSQSALFTTNILMLGKLGTPFLAAGTLAYSFMMPFFLFGISVVAAVAPLAAQARGRGRVDRVADTVTQGLVASLLLAVALVCILLQIGSVFRLIGQDPGLTERAVRYMKVASLMLLPAFWFLVLRSLMSAYGRTRAVFVITIGGVVLNAFLSNMLIFGAYGAPALGMEGAAISNAASYAFMAIAAAVYIRLDGELRETVRLRALSHPNWVELWRIFRFGVPFGLILFAELIVFSGAALVMSYIGQEEVAAHAIAMQMGGLTYTVPLGIGAAATVRVGMAYGRRDELAIQAAGWVSIALGGAFMLVAGIVFVVFGRDVIAIFLDPSAPGGHRTFELAVGYLAIAGLYQLADGAQVNAAHALRGLNDTIVPMLIAFGGYWLVSAPLGIYLALGTGLGGVGIWIGLAVGLVVVAISLVTRFALRKQLRIVAF